MFWVFDLVMWFDVFKVVQGCAFKASRFSVSCFRLRVSCYAFQASRFMLRVSCFAFQAARFSASRFKLRVSSCAFNAARFNALGFSVSGGYWLKINYSQPDCVSRQGYSLFAFHSSLFVLHFSLFFLKLLITKT